MLKIEPTRNKDDIMHVLSSPGVWENIVGDDYVDHESFNIKFDLKTVFLLGRVGDRIIGCGIVHKTDEWKVHLNIIPEYRKKYAERFAEIALNWIWERIKPLKVVAEIHPKFANVISFAERMGFKEIEPNSDKRCFELQRPV